MPTLCDVVISCRPPSKIAASVGCSGGVAGASWGAGATELPCSKVKKECCGQEGLVCKSYHSQSIFDNNRSAWGSVFHTHSYSTDCQRFMSFKVTRLYLMNKKGEHAKDVVLLGTPGWT